MQFRMPVVVCAGGHGKVMRPGHSKLGDMIGDTPIIVRVLDNIKAAGCFGQIYVVVNPLLGRGLQEILEEAGHKGVQYVFQRERRGAANAVYQVLPLLRDKGLDHFLVMFGEMPFLSSGILAEVARVHNEFLPSVTFLGVPYDPGHRLAPALSRYTYLKHGWNGFSTQANFLRMYTGEPPEAEDVILGSVYCFERQWFEEQYPAIKPLDTKNDGFGAEVHLPPLIEAAVSGSAHIRYVQRNVPEQILGINTVEDFRLAETVAGNCMVI